MERRSKRRWAGETESEQVGEQMSEHVTCQCEVCEFHSGRGWMFSATYDDGPKENIIIAAGHCLTCGTRLNADGTVTPMVPRDALRLATGFYMAEYVGRRTDAGELFDGDIKALWANAICTAEDLADGDVGVRIAALTERIEQAALDAGKGGGDDD